MRARASCNDTTAQHAPDRISQINVTARSYCATLPVPFNDGLSDCRSLCVAGTGICLLIGLIKRRFRDPFKITKTGGEHAGKSIVDESLRVSNILGASGGLRTLAGLPKQCVAELWPRPNALTRVCYRTEHSRRSRPSRASVTMVPQ